MLRDLIKQARYSPWWSVTSNLTKYFYLGRCCMCYRRGRHAHHGFYGLFRVLPIPGLEIPGVQVFYLCQHCHYRQAHGKGNYRSYRNPWANHNRLDFLVGLWLRSLPFWLLWGWLYLTLVHPVLSPFYPLLIATLTG